MLPTFLAGWVTRFLAATLPVAPDTPPSETKQQKAIQFRLRHAHAVSSAAQVLFSDVSVGDASSSPLLYQGDVVETEYTIPFTRKIQTSRPPSYAAYAAARHRSIWHEQSELMDWVDEIIIGPDLESRAVLLELAKMTNNAYTVPGTDRWYDLEGKWNHSYPFGWEDDADGFRGHVFATEDNSTVVLSIKGTSAAFIGGGGPTTKKDKLNDNLLFSCCCAHVDWSWKSVCDCYRGRYRCDQTCLEESLVEESLFYPVGVNLYNNLTYLYPDSDIWIIGHSLGGALASLIGVTFGVPVVAFEAPGEKMAADRLHLPLPRSMNHVTHVYHTADPIAMGTCNGVFSTCAIGGYVMESACHLGQSIVYDTVTNLSWAVDIRTHPIVNVVERLLNEPWEESTKAGREVPLPKLQEDCVECFRWEFGNFP